MLMIIALIISDINRVASSEWYLSCVITYFRRCEGLIPRGTLRESPRTLMKMLFLQALQANDDEYRKNVMVDSSHR